MRMDSPDDYTRWIERAARRLEEHMRDENLSRAEEEIQLIEKTLKVIREKLAQHDAIER
jgi:hypothetical protein